MTTLDVRKGDWFDRMEEATAPNMASSRTIRRSSAANSQAEVQTRAPMMSRNESTDFCGHHPADGASERVDHDEQECESGDCWAYTQDGVVYAVAHTMHGGNRRAICGRFLGDDSDSHGLQLPRLRLRDVSKYLEAE